MQPFSTKHLLTMKVCNDSDYLVLKQDFKKEITIVYRFRETAGLKIICGHQVAFWLWTHFNKIYCTQFMTGHFRMENVRNKPGHLEFE